MSNERKMLEFAAKACGQPFDAEASIQKKGVNVWWGLWVNGTSEYDQGHYWNPLTSSSDCAAMCAKLNIDVMWFYDQVECDAHPTQDNNFAALFKDHNNDREAAWRFAACKVAEAIGMAMK